jgi:superfamily II DNA/RNA helicase/very-short-patch-repair endonuclease
VLAGQGVLHAEHRRIFARKNEAGTVLSPIRLHRHQVEGIRAARAGESYILTTGTGSGKSLAYIVPIVDHVLRSGSGRGIQAIVVYPMNALANSQIGELTKYLCRGYPDGKPKVTFKRYTGQEKPEERRQILAQPPDILLTNFVMLELLLTRPGEDRLIRDAKNLRFLVLDELHTYRGRQGADVALLVRRVRTACGAQNIVHVGTSATLAGEGNWEDQQHAVAQVATQVFGTTIERRNVIGETLRRVTPWPHEVPDFAGRLRAAVANADTPPADFAARFVQHPLAIWIESNLGLRMEPETGKLVRCPPLPLSGPDSAAQRLASETGCAEEVCGEALRRALLAGYRCKNAEDRPLFAFRLHQLIAKGESVYASPEDEVKRHITLQAQQFVPGSDRAQVLLPLVFCRECGQEYYVVRRTRDPDGRTRYVEGNSSDAVHDRNDAVGYLYLSSTSPWPMDPGELVQRLPDSWVDVNEDGRRVVRKSLQQRLPRRIALSAAGVEGGGHQLAWFVEAPFLFCLQCGVTYDAHQSSDFGKLATLGSEGRSTATSILSLATVRRLRRDSTLDAEARKLLSFTDNRQDASLQAGHFNDFVGISLLRSAIHRAVVQAVSSAGAAGVRHDELTRRVFDALALPLAYYAANPSVEYVQRDETERALRQVLGYYVYRDLRRGWRITSPNLEQCGLLDVGYLSLDRFCADEDKWRQRHPVLATASPEEREHVCRVLLDHMRRELAIRVELLDPLSQESLRQLSSQYLLEPWSLDEEERLEQSRIVLPRSRGNERKAQPRFVYLSALGGFGRFLKRMGTFGGYEGELKKADVEVVLPDLLEALTVPGIVHRVLDPRDKNDVGGYQINASALVWRPGTADRAVHDPLRVPNAPEGGLRPNPFFAAFYRSDTDDLKQLEAREHTAQVPADLRESREEKFREGRLPVLYCSPTMELGVDIQQLNVVNLRNVPPTPANYAQRSGRAGRSGQPALVLTYCSAGSPHDQYFFRRPEKMVSGAVVAPRLDLQNEDLLRAHVHAVWLGAARLDLGDTLADVLDVVGDEPTLTVLPRVKDKLEATPLQDKAAELLKATLAQEIAELVGPHGDMDEWIRRVLREIPTSFERACERWRSLYRAALKQSKDQAKIVRDASREPRDRDSARRLRDEADAQLRLLTERKDHQQSDFYSYRYFASEGFLPGYNFPRLPLSAYLPARKQKKGSDYLTRPRFLAISEFGPRSIVYHEGSRYVVGKVILPVDSEEVSIKKEAALCGQCGYLHPAVQRVTPDTCEVCGNKLDRPWDNLFRMQNVSTRRRDRINSDEEERMRIGYDIKTGVRFAERGGVRSAREASLIDPTGQVLATLTYGHSATLWRMNLGWRRRKDQSQLGYRLDLERGIWAKSEVPGDDEHPEDPMSPRVERVIPFVEDHRNCLIVRPSGDLDLRAMASLEAALKAAIQVKFQLEDRELAGEALPDSHERRALLFYEAAEGGAGVLRRLVDDQRALPSVARLALEISHHDPDALTDLRRAPRSREDCEAACYDCLLSYYNQRDHRWLDRKLLPDILAGWRDAEVVLSPVALPRSEHVERLLRLCESELERRWLRLVDHLGLALPDDAQAPLPDAAARPDFVYSLRDVAIFVDGPHHDREDQRAADRQQDERLRDRGMSVIRFHHAADWEAIFARYPSVFGEPTARSDRPPAPADRGSPPRPIDRGDKRS